METPALRMLDANANRAREALRVLEDYARFALNDSVLSTELKSIRHDLAGALSAFPDAILSRDTSADVGTTIKTPRELVREDLPAVVIAAGKRLSEALRVIEELLKTLPAGSGGTGGGEGDAATANLSAAIERARYRGYIVEQTLTRAALQQSRFTSIRLYVLVTESLCHLPWEQTLDAILTVCSTGSSLQAANQTPASSPHHADPTSAISPNAPFLAIQLREKSLPDTELLRRARILVAKCRAANALPIINDRPDIALLSGAIDAGGGIHLGQTDLPAAEARKLLGHRAIIGVSTENLTQAQQAVRDGATYIGVGPMFPTTTKEKPCIVGPTYAAEALAHIPLPAVAIGGITPGNLRQLLAVGVRTIAVCSAIISDPGPAARCRELLTLLSNNRVP